MKSTRKDILAAVRQSYERCCEEADFFTVFYGIFLKQSDEIAAMFKETDWQRQKQLIQRAIKSAILYAAEPNVPAVKKHIEDLGRMHSHAHINVSPGLYPVWLDSMVAAVKQCDPKYSEELGNHWKAVLTPTIELMISKYESA